MEPLLRPALAVLCVLLAASSCAAPAAGDFEVLNTVEAWPKTSITTVLRVPDDRRGSPPATLRLLTTVRLRQGQGAGEFRHASAVAALSDGAFLVVDKRLGDVSLFATTEEARSVTDRRPAPEFRLLTPTAIARSSDGVWLVGDWSNGLKLFNEAPGVVFKPRLVVPTDGVTTGACSLGESFLVRGAWADGTAIHEIDTKGRLVRTFGHAYQHPSASVRPSMSTGLVACDPLNATVVSIGSAFPLVHGYTKTGELLWTTEISGLSLQRVAYGTGSNGTAVVRHERDSVTDTPASLVVLGASEVLLQFVRVEKLAVDDIRTTVLSVMLNTSNGSASYLGEGWPLVLAAAGPRLYTTEPADPTSVEVYEVLR